MIAFLATYDIVSQAQARFLATVYRARAAEINVAVVVLEPPENRPLAEAFRDALHLEFPVAMGDAETIAGHGPLGDVHAVPTTVVLDAKGRIVSKLIGLQKDDDLARAVDAI